MTPTRFGVLVAVATFAADQASKLWLLFGYDLPMREPVAVTPFLNLIVVWNRGISYGLLQQGSDLGRWALVILSILATVAIGWWLRSAATRVLGTALGLLAGGALGNAVDRAVYAAVFDFAQLHWGSWSWYVFNIADVAIVAGVVGLLYDSLVEGRRVPRAG